MDRPEGAVSCASIGIGITVEDNEFRMFVSLGEHENQPTHVMAVPNDQLHRIIHTLMACAQHTEELNSQLEDLAPEDRADRIMNLFARYAAGSN